MVCLGRPYHFIFFKGCLFTNFTWSILEYLDLNAGCFIYFLLQITCSIPKVYFSEMQQSLRREHIDVRIVIRLSAKSTKSSKALKQFVGKLPTNCLILLDHFVGLVIKAYFSGLRLNFSSPFIYISDNTIFE